MQIIIKIINNAPATSGPVAATETTEARESLVELSADEWRSRQEALNKNLRAA